MRAHVFGYASLVSAAHRLVTLCGHRRVWGVAMDNRVAVPGYKVYERADGSRPAVDVAFLDLQPDPQAAITGGLLPVDADALAALDARERQYRRIDVTAAIDPAPPAEARVWTYVGRPPGRERVRRAQGGRLGGDPARLSRRRPPGLPRVRRRRAPALRGEHRAPAVPGARARADRSAGLAEAFHGWVNLPPAPRPTCVPRAPRSAPAPPRPASRSAGWCRRPPDATARRGRTGGRAARWPRAGRRARSGR
jgi:gamma-glutamyl AIG2-like cyclotransferase